MLHASIRFGYAVMMIASAAISFLFLRNMDETEIQGPTYTIDVLKSDEAKGSVQVAHAIELFAQEHGVNVGRLYFDPYDVNVRRVFLAVGDQGADSTNWLKMGYPRFSRESEVKVQPFQESAVYEPDGIYFLFGTASTARELLDEFTDLGFNGELMPTLTAESALGYFAQESTIYMYLIVGLFGIVTVAAAVALNAKSYGVQRLHGHAFFTLLARDFRQLATFVLCSGIVIGITTIVALYTYNGLNQLRMFANIAGLIAGTYALTAIATHIVTLALLHRSFIVDAIKGDITANWAIVGSYVLRGWGILLILSIGTGVAGGVVKLHDKRAQFHELQTLGDAYYIRVSGAIEYLTAGRDISQKLGQWIREADSRDEISMAYSPRLPDITQDLIIVNSRYLTKHQILGADGSRVVPEHEMRSRILIPQSLMPRSADLVAAARRWAAKRAVQASAKPAAANFEVEAVRDSQSLMRYALPEGTRSLRLENPVVIVLPSTNELLSPLDYLSIATRGEILFENADKVMVDLAHRDIGPYVLGMNPFTKDAAQDYRDARRELTVQLFNLAAGIVLLLVTAATVSMIYCRRNLQTLFVKHLHGWGFVRTHWIILSVEVLLGGALVLWTWDKTYTLMNAQNDPSVPPLAPRELVLGGWEPAIAVGISLASVVVLVSFLIRINMRFVKLHSANAR